MRGFFNGSRITALIFLIVGIIFLADAYTFKPDFLDPSLKLGPMDYPLWLIYGWIVLSFVFFIFDKSKFDISEISKSKIALSRAILITAFYFFLFPYLGLFVSSLLFFIAFLISEGYRNYKIGISVAIMSSFLFTYVFEHLLKISMPRGILVIFD
jgi:ABC-type multidrug transport system fused ATPase/permease subunit